MHRAFAILVLATLGAAPAFAEEPAKAPSAGGTPDKMPFDTPYGMPIALDSAQKLVAAAETEAKTRGWKMNVAVVDPNGELIAFARMDNAQIASVPISQRKARIAARFRRETRAFFNATEAGHSGVMTLDPEMVASPGGFPLIIDGKLVGGLGCSGGTGDQDAVVCKAALEALK